MDRGRRSFGHKGGDSGTPRPFRDPQNILLRDWKSPEGWSATRDKGRGRKQSPLLGRPLKEPSSVRRGPELDGAETGQWSPVYSSSHTTRGGGPHEQESG